MKQVFDVLALGGAMGGSALIAANIGLNQLGYLLFFLSSVSSLVLLRRVDNAPKALVYQTVFFIVMNLIGLIRY